MILAETKKPTLRLAFVFGGGDRDRTCDLLNANQMLSQLSYTPTRSFSELLKMDYHPALVNGIFMRFGRDLKYQLPNGEYLGARSR